MEAKGFLDYIKRYPDIFSFVSFTGGIFGFARLIQWSGFFDPFPYLKEYSWFILPGVLGSIDHTSDFWC